MPNRNCVDSEPSRLTGRIIITITGIRNDSNWDASTKYTRPSATIRAVPRLRKESIMSLLSPSIFTVTPSGG